MFSQTQKPRQEPLDTLTTSSPDVRRVGTVRAVLVGSDHVDTITESLDAVASLRTSSAIAGALRLESYCRELETGLKQGQSPDVTAVKAAVAANIGQIIREASSRGHLPST